MRALTGACAVVGLLLGMLGAPGPVRAQDPVAPTLELSSIPAATTQEASVRIAGVARDEDGSVQEVTVLNDVIGTPLAADLDAGGNFSIDVPLDVGPNHIELTAIDDLGNESTPAVVDVTRELAAVPQVEVDSPTNGLQTLEGAVDVSGRILTSLPIDDLSVRLGNLRAIPTVAGSAYAFTFPAVPLQVGANTLEVAVFSPYGSVRDAVVVERIDPDAGEEAQPPVIELPFGSTELVVQGGLFELTGFVRAQNCVAAIEVNGLAVDDADIVRINGSDVSFRSSVAVDPDTTYPITIEATGCNGLAATVTLSVSRDDTAPIIVLTEPTDTTGVLNVVDNPLRVAGYIDEPNLAGAMIGNHVLTLEPAAQANRWTFDLGLNLDRGSQTTIRILAWDRAGHEAVLEFQALLDGTVTVAFVTPRSGDELGLDSGGGEISATVQVRGAGSTDVTWLQVDGQTGVSMGSDEGNHSGMVGPLSAGASHTLTASVVSEGGDVLARTSVDVTTLDLDAVPVLLTRAEPPGGAQGVETDATIGLFFNRPVDPETLEVQVRQTVHGFVYQGAAGGADLRDVSRVERVRVDKDREPVGGTTQNLPGNRAFSFMPYASWTYGATVDVDVLVNGSSVARNQFQVRSFPTLSHGFALSEFFDPVEGVEVWLPDLDHRTTTDPDGLFSFGYGWPSDEVLAGGLHRVIFNPGGKNPRYAMVEGWLDVMSERVNAGQSFVVPSIPTDAKFTGVQGGERVVFDQGRVVLGLEAATVEFPDGSSSGPVSPRMTDIASTGYQAVMLETPLFAVRLDPGGVRVAGPVTLEIDLPRMHDNYEWLDTIPHMDGHFPVAILYGLDPNRLWLAPVGVVQLDREVGRVMMPQPTDRLERLDVLALALPRLGAIEVATQYIAGEATFDAVLAALGGG